MLPHHSTAILNGVRNL